MESMVLYRTVRCRSNERGQWRTSPGLMVRTGMRIASVTCCSSRSTESASTLSSQPGFSIFFLSAPPLPSPPSPPLSPPLSLSLPLSLKVALRPIDPRAASRLASALALAGIPYLSTMLSLIDFSLSLSLSLSLFSLSSPSLSSPLSLSLSSLSLSRSWTARSWGSNQEQVKTGWGAERDAAVGYVLHPLSSIFYQVNVFESCHKTTDTDTCKSKVTGAAIYRNWLFPNEEV